MRTGNWLRHVVIFALTVGAAVTLVPLATFSQSTPTDLDSELAQVLQKHNFDGKLQEKLRPIDKELADLGRLVFFDRILALHRDNPCAGCHAPFRVFADSQSIAIGVDNNGIVGPDRKGPRNQRRSPSISNTAFYPRLMWDGRFSAGSNNPFDNSEGFRFPLPEGSAKFPANDPVVTHLLIAQAHIPSTELPEMAGFTGTGNSDNNSLIRKQALFREVLMPKPVFTAPQTLTTKLQTTPPVCDTAVHDNGQGLPVPPRKTSEDSEFRNEPIRAAVERDVNSVAEYVKLFGESFPKIKAGKAITFDEISIAIAEFEFSLTFADAPLDKFARGQRAAMTDEQKRGAVLFFGKANCVSCHTVDGYSNQLFSDFANHNIGVPQLFPKFGKQTGNVCFQGNLDEDFGTENSTGNSADRYKFRTAPLRNLRHQATFFHNGAFTRIEDAIRHHLDPVQSARRYDPKAAGVKPDLHVGPIEPVLKRLDPLVTSTIALSQAEINDLIAFVRDGLTDTRTEPAELCKLVPKALPSGLPVGRYQGCENL